MIDAAAQNDPKLVEKFQEIRALYPDGPEDRVWSAVAEAFDLAGDGPRMLAALERCTALNPEWGAHHLAMAKARLRAHQWMHSLKALERASELDGSGLRREVFSENVLYYLGYALFGAGRYKEAAEAWRGADRDIQYWRSADPLKDFHLHRGWAHHLERELLDALEAYRRGLVAPGPGDCALDDDMDTDDVEAAQERMNPTIQAYLDMAASGNIPDAADLDATPYTAPPDGRSGN